MPTAVIPRESGESSTPQLLRIPSPSLEYWIARSSRAMTVEGVANSFFHVIASLRSQ